MIPQFDDPPPPYSLGPPPAYSQSGPPPAYTESKPNWRYQQREFSPSRAWNCSLPSHNWMPHPSSLYAVSTISFIALFIIGCLAIHKGRICPHQLAWGTIGCTGIISCINVFPSLIHPNNKKIFLSALAIIYLSLGILALKETVTGTLLGLAIVVPIASLLTICCCCGCCCLYCLIQGSLTKIF